MDPAEVCEGNGERITDASARLRKWPELGQVLREFPAYREIVVGNFRLIYREDESNRRVVILGVIHAGRDLPSVLELRKG